MIIYSWQGKKELLEYRFENGKCVGLFRNGVLMEKCEGLELTTEWEIRAEARGFK